MIQDLPLSISSSWFMIRVETLDTIHILVCQFRCETSPFSHVTHYSSLNILIDLPSSQGAGSSLSLYLCTCGSVYWEVTWSYSLVGNLKFPSSVYMC